MTSQETADAPAQYRVKLIIDIGHYDVGTLADEYSYWEVAVACTWDAISVLSARQACKSIQPGSHSSLEDLHLSSTHADTCWKTWRGSQSWHLNGIAGDQQPKLSDRMKDWITFSMCHCQGGDVGRAKCSRHISYEKCSQNSLVKVVCTSNGEYKPQQEADSADLRQSSRQETLRSIMSNTRKSKI